MAPGTSIRRQPISAGQPAEQIDGRDHRPALAVQLGEGRQAAACCRGPRARRSWPAACPPHAGRRSPDDRQTGRRSRSSGGSADRCPARGDSRPTRTCRSDRAAAWCGCRARRAAGRPAAAIDQQVPIADARMELKSLAAQFLLGGLRCSSAASAEEMWPGREALHHLVFDGDQIAADGPIVRAQLDSLGGGLQGGPAGEMLDRVVAQQAQIGRVGAGRQASRAYGWRGRPRRPPPRRPSPESWRPEAASCRRATLAARRRNRRE